MVFGVALLVGGFTVLAVVRPWQGEPRPRTTRRRSPVSAPPSPPRPRPGSGGQTAPGARRPHPARRGPASATTAAAARPAAARPTERAAAPAPAEATLLSAATPAAADRRTPVVVGTGVPGINAESRFAHRPRTVLAMAQTRSESPAAQLVSSAASAPAAQLVSSAASASAPQLVSSAAPASAATGGDVGGSVHPIRQDAAASTPRPMPRRRAAEPLPDQSADRAAAAPVPTPALPSGFGPSLVAVPGGGAGAGAGETVRRHRMEALQRPRRVATDADQTDIVLPEWLGPFSDGDAAPVRARHAG
ncbi:hypothetical protein [Catellatospora tritici]|uniref:hypothetical protein n=1 Tax=Catellatospora tritici TaxID=2851566 RepID=UPI001C2D4E02|nr:hypothetical protein [Catellatospora tritici]MBV1849102.1 hypothetical protein [Catellatospora tritici]